MDATQPVVVSRHQRNVLLVGNVGAGKSTLGNYLLRYTDPSRADLFVSGYGPNAITRECEIKTNLFDQFKINVIDTPGIDDIEQDTEKQIGVLRTLQNQGSISAVVLCAPFD